MKNKKDAIVTMRARCLVRVQSPVQKIWDNLIKQWRTHQQYRELINWKEGLLFFNLTSSVNNCLSFDVRIYIITVKFINFASLPVISFISWFLKDHFQFNGPSPQQSPQFFSNAWLEANLRGTVSPFVALYIRT